MTAIALAMPEEWAGLAPHMPDAVPEIIAGRQLFRGQLGGAQAAVFLTGSGPAAANAAGRECLAALRPDRLVIAGFGGGLAPGPGAGDLVAATTVSAAGNGPSLPSDASMLAAAAAATPAGAALYEGPLITVRDVITSAAGKQRLWDETAAVAVDMESAPLAQAAASAGLPFLAVRCITDAAGEAMPLDFNRYLGADGQLRRGAIVMAVLRRPQLIPGLVRLGRNSGRAARHLGAFLEALCREMG